MMFHLDVIKRKIASKNIENVFTALSRRRVRARARNTENTDIKKGSTQTPRAGEEAEAHSEA